MTETTTAWVPLESGDRLTREEFHRRYCARPDITQAELVNGVVYVLPSPLRHGFHSRPHGMVMLWLEYYASLHPGVDVSDNATVIISEESELQPDSALFRTTPDATLRLRDDDYLEGTPELVVEVAASSASYDLHDKMEVYRAAGVQEYVVWLTYERRFRWFHLRGGEYVERTPDERGVIESEAFPGLRLDVPKMLAFDRAGVLVALNPPAAPPTNTPAPSE